MREGLLGKSIVFSFSPSSHRTVPATSSEFRPFVSLTFLPQEIPTIMRSALPFSLWRRRLCVPLQSRRRFVLPTFNQFPSPHRQSRIPIFICNPKFLPLILLNSNSSSLNPAIGNRFAFKHRFGFGDEGSGCHEFQPMDLVLINSEEKVFVVEGQVIQVQSNWCDMGCLECPHKVEEDWRTFADTIRKLLKLQKSSKPIN
ncbi:unnamed protein product [Linum tenue]|uniref:Uncharacterized protein n=1 Tax=Linum tenue TaxID=586396 RepID=A0AAV0I087_9ROSI|nr:unnamed protein product [Linum tenue]